MSNPVIAAYGETVSRKTTSPGQYDPVTGEWTPGSETTESLFATILPLTDKALTEVKPEGLEANFGIAIYSNTALKSADEDTQQAPDTIVWQGREFIVFSVVPRYQIASLAHFKSIAFLKDS